MAAVRSELAGQTEAILVVRMPALVVDETVGQILGEVARRLPNADGAGVVLDCREVELINSIGITCLLQVQDDCRRRRAGMAIAAVPEPIVSFLRQLKLDARFRRLATVDEAVADLERPQR